MKDNIRPETSAQNQEAPKTEQTESKKLRTGLKIRTRIVAGDGGSDNGGGGDEAAPGATNHGLKIRA